MPEQFAPTHGAYGGTMVVGVAIEPAGKELMLGKARIVLQVRGGGGLLTVDGRGRVVQDPGVLILKKVQRADGRVIVDERRAASTTVLRLPRFQANAKRAGNRGNRDYKAPGRGFTLPVSE